MSWDSPGWKKANADYHADRTADQRTKPVEAPRPKPNGNSTAKVDEVVIRLPITAEPPSLDSKRASAYQMRGITWFWPGRFALGKLGLIGGLPDKGKGLISADVIALCTTGGNWPCGEGTAPKGNVIWFTAEDD